MQFLKWSSNLDNIFHSLCFKSLEVNDVKLTGIACFFLPFSCCHFQQWTSNLSSPIKAAKFNIHLKTYNQPRNPFQTPQKHTTEKLKPNCTFVPYHSSSWIYFCNPFAFTTLQHLLLLIFVFFFFPGRKPWCHYFIFLVNVNSTVK